MLVDRERPCIRWRAWLSFSRSPHILRGSFCVLKMAGSRGVVSGKARKRGLFCFLDPGVGAPGSDDACCAPLPVFFCSNGRGNKMPSKMLLLNKASSRRNLLISFLRQQLLEATRLRRKTDDLIVFAALFGACFLSQAASFSLEKSVILC